MLPTLSLHLHRLASRHKVRFERADPQRVDRLLRYYVKSLPVLLDAERCNILVYNPGEQRAWVEVGTSAHHGESSALARATLVGSVIVSRKLTIASESAGTGEAFPEGRGAAKRAGRNAICAPVLSRHHDEVVGVIEVLDKKDGARFDERDASVLEEAAEGVRDLVDSLFLGQKVFGATDTVLAVGEWTLGGAVGLLLLGSLLTLLALVALPSMGVVGEALGPLMAPLVAP